MRKEDLVQWAKMDDTTDNVIEFIGSNNVWNVFENWLNKTAKYQIKLSNKQIMFGILLHCSSLSLLYNPVNSLTQYKEIINLRKTFNVSRLNNLYLMTITYKNTYLAQVDINGLFFLWFGRKSFIVSSAYLTYLAMIAVQ